MKNLIQRIIDLKQLWELTAAGIPVIEDSRLVKWLGEYSDSELEYAFVRVNNQLRRGVVRRETLEVARYVSGVLRNQAEYTKAKLARVLARNREQMAQTGVAA